MRLKIVLEVNKRGAVLPLSYQYEISSWIYSLIESGNPEFAHFIHTNGYDLGKRQFKLFTFSSLTVPRYQIMGDRMKILSREVELVVSMYVKNIGEPLIQGLFKNQSATIGDRTSRVNMRVREVEMVPLHLPTDNNKVRLRTTSPMVVGRPDRTRGGKLSQQYLPPTDSDFAYYFTQNLLQKYDTVCAHGLMDSFPQTPPVGFRLLSNRPKRRGIRIKADTRAETKIIGYLFDFELTAPVELIRLGMLAGFGGKNALGFGATRVE